MVQFEDTRKGFSSGDLWQDSALNAARLMEKFLHQEEQCLPLSELMSGSVPDYDRNGPSMQYIVTEAASDTVDSVPPAIEGVRRVGPLRGTSFMYKSVGKKLWLWDVCDKSGTRSCAFVPSRFDIVAVGVAESRDPACQYWLIVATVFDVSLFYFNPDSITEETPPVLSGYVAATGGVRITAICDPNTSKRIFLGGDDGSVFELVYASSGSKSLWSSLGLTSDRRCYLSVLSRPLSAMLPPFMQSIASLVSSAASVRAIQVCACRQLLFAVSGSCHLSVFSLTTGSGVAELSEYTISESVKSAYRSAGDGGAATAEVIEILPSNPHVGGEVCCVLVTRSGARVFVRATKGMYATTVVGKGCKNCDKSRQFTYPVSQLSVLAVRVPPVELTVDSALSPDSGRTVVMTGSAVAIVRPDESSIAQRQAVVGSVSHGAKFRERFDTIPVIGNVAGGLLVVEPVTLPSIAVSDSLLTTTTEDLIGGASAGWKFTVVTSEREITVSPLSTSEQLMELVKSQNLYAVRDFSIQWRPEQLAALLVGVLVTAQATGGPVGSAKQSPMHTGSLGGSVHVNPESLVERMLFSAETASALSLVDAPGLGGPAAGAREMGPLGAVLQTETQNISARTKGVALLVSRVVRPVWFAKAFVLETVAGEASVEYLVVKPALSASARQFITNLLRPLANTLTQYRYQLGEFGESKLIEGFIVLINAVVEAMELLRLFETGQLNKRRTDEVAIADDTNVLDGVDALMIRDLAISAGVGEPVLISLLGRAGIDLSLARKHCSLIVPSA